MSNNQKRRGWEADRMLHLYILDYLQKRNFTQSAAAFSSEANVGDTPIPIDAPGGFLFEWWGVFWDIFSARVSKSASKEAQQYVEWQQRSEQARPRGSHGASPQLPQMSPMLQQTAQQQAQAQQQGQAQPPTPQMALAFPPQGQGQPQRMDSQFGGHASPGVLGVSPAMGTVQKMPPMLMKKDDGMDEPMMSPFIGQPPASQRRQSVQSLLQAQQQAQQQQQQQAGQRPWPVQLQMPAASMGGASQGPGGLPSAKRLKTDGPAFFGGSSVPAGVLGGIHPQAQQQQPGPQGQPPMSQGGAGLALAGGMHGDSMGGSAILAHLQHQQAQSHAAQQQQQQQQQQHLIHHGTLDSQQQMSGNSAAAVAAAQVRMAAMRGQGEAPDAARQQQRYRQQLMMNERAAAAGGMPGSAASAAAAAAAAAREQQHRYNMQQQQQQQQLMQLQQQHVGHPSGQPGGPPGMGAGPQIQHLSGANIPQNIRIAAAQNAASADSKAAMALQQQVHMQRQS
eukprot:Opistho-1_new@6266